MKMTWTIASLILLALAASVVASYEKTDNYGLSEGHYPCGDLVVKASKVEKPAYFASPDAINQALKGKGVANALDGPSPYNGDDGKAYEELQNLLYMKPGVAVAPKFEPIGDSYGKQKNSINVVGVTPAYPGKNYPAKPHPANYGTAPAPHAYPAPSAYPPVPSPYPATPASYSPAYPAAAPAPYEPASYAPAKAPIPYGPAHSPYASAPVPYALAKMPSSYAPTPAPYTPAPYGPAPAPYAPAPLPYGPAPTPCAPAPSPYGPAPDPYMSSVYPDAPVPAYPGAPAPAYPGAPAYPVAKSFPASSYSAAEGYPSPNYPGAPAPAYPGAPAPSYPGAPAPSYPNTPAYPAGKSYLAPAPYAPASGYSATDMYAPTNSGYSTPAAKAYPAGPQYLPHDDDKRATPRLTYGFTVRHGPRGPCVSYPARAYSDAPSHPARNSYPAPAYPGAPAPAYPGTPAPAYPNAPASAPAYPDAPAPAYPGTPAPAHPGTPAPAYPAGKSYPAPAPYGSAPASGFPATDLYAATYSGYPTPAAKAYPAGPQYLPHDDDDQGLSFAEQEQPYRNQPVIPADPVSISLAYKNLVQTPSYKKYVPEDRLAFGHRQQPADGQMCHQIADVPEEKLMTVDKPIVELKLTSKYPNMGYSESNSYPDLEALEREKLEYDAEQANGASAPYVSYSDLGYTPVAPSKNQFITQTHGSANQAAIAAAAYTRPTAPTAYQSHGSHTPPSSCYKPGSIIVEEVKNNYGNEEEYVYGGYGSSKGSKHRRGSYESDESASGEEVSCGCSTSSIIDRIKSGYKRKSNRY